MLSRIRIRSSGISLRASLCLLRNISLTEASNDSTLTKFHHGKEAAESTHDETSGLVGERPWGDLDESSTLGNPWQFVFCAPTLQPNIPKLQDFPLLLSSYRAQSLKMNRIVRVNAGGKVFATKWSTLCRWPDSGLSKIVQSESKPMHLKGKSWKKSAPVAQPPVASTAQGDEGIQQSSTDASPGPRQLFLDCDPEVFQHVLAFLRTGSITLPSNNEVLRSSIVHQLDAWGLTPFAFAKSKPAATGEDGEPAEGSSSDQAPLDGQGEAVALPDIVAVQLCDQMQLDQGSKRHAVTITYGADGFHLRSLCKTARKDLGSLMSSTYWQMYQTNERSAFFVSTRMSSGSADLLMTSLSQRVIEHTEKMGYSLVNGYVTISPDIQFVSVRLFVHWLIFRRVRSPTLEFADVDSLALVEEAGARKPGGDADADAEWANLGGMPSANGQSHPRSAGRTGPEGEDDYRFKNFEPPHVGPKGPEPNPPIVPKGARVDKIWDD